MLRASLRFATFAFFCWAAPSLAFGCGNVSDAEATEAALGPTDPRPPHYEHTVRTDCPVFRARRFSDRVLTTWSKRTEINAILLRIPRPENTPEDHFVNEFWNATPRYDRDTSWVLDDDRGVSRALVAAGKGGPDFSVLFFSTHTDAKRRSDVSRHDLGYAILFIAFDEALSRGYENSEWKMLESNTVAYRFYESFGAKVTGKKRVRETEQFDVTFTVRLEDARARLEALLAQNGIGVTDND